MKVPFSYEKNFLMPVLAGSLLLHGLTFGLSGWVNFSPRYNVVSAPNSVEIVMIQEKTEPPMIEKTRDESVLSVEDESPVLTPRAIESAQEPSESVKEKPVTPKEDPRPQILTAPEQGALTQAVPDGLKNKAPAYPYIARLRGWEGTVYLSVRVSPGGRVESIDISASSGQKVLDQAALRAVMGWQFKPAHAGGIPIRSTVEIPVRFILENEIR